MRVDESRRESSRVAESRPESPRARNERFRPNKGKSLNSCQLSFSFGPSSTFQSFLSSPLPPYSSLLYQEKNNNFKFLNSFISLIILNCRCFLKDEEKLFHSLKPSLEEGICTGKDLSLHFVPSRGAIIPKATEKMLPVISVEDNIKAVSFDWEKYQDYLQTKVLGRMVFYTDVITSTQEVFDGSV